MAIECECPDCGCQFWEDDYDSFNYRDLEEEFENGVKHGRKLERANLNLNIQVLSQPRGFTVTDFDVFGSGDTELEAMQDYLRRLTSGS